MRRCLLLLVLMPAVFFALPAGVSSACTCAMTTRAQATANADVVFKGTVVGEEDPDGGGPYISSGRDVFYAFDVDEVVKGAADDPAQVVTAAEGASCGADFVVGRRYLVFADRDGERLTSSLCSGNDRLPALPAAAGDQTESAMPDPLLGDIPADDDRRPMLAILGAFAVAGGVVAIAIGRVRQRRILDES